MNRMSSLLKIFIICLVAMMAGCKQDSSTPIEPTQTSLLTYQPKGTISGLIRNSVTAAPVAGAVISVGYDGSVHSVTSDGSGAFSFANVPVGQYQITSTQTVFSGTYMMTVSLVNYNATQTNPNMKYRPYYYDSVTVKFTSLAPGDSLAVSDMVGIARLNISYLNTTVTGLIVDTTQQPVANARVMLYDATVTPNVLLAQTLSSASGAYMFLQVDNGLKITINAQSSDGSLQGSLVGFTLPASDTTATDSLRSQYTMERIMITPVDNVHPFLIALSPENNSDVPPSNLQVVYTFSEPIRQTAYTRTDLPLGSGTIIDDITVTYVGFKKTTAAIPYSASWNANFTQLTLAPQGIVGSAKYTVNAVTAFGKLTDNANLSVINNTLITGDFEVLHFTTSGGSTPPAAPALQRRYVSGYFGALDFTGGPLGLEWNYDPNARSYNIYRSINNGSFDLLQSNVFALQASDTCPSLVVPAGAANPLTADTVRYRVCGVSKDLVEGPVSSIVTVADVVKPHMDTTKVSVSGAAKSWTYTLRFSEPLNISTAESIGNYSFGKTGAVTFTPNTANYLGNNGAGSYIVLLAVTTTSAPTAGYTLTVSNVSDLAGNVDDPTANVKTF